MKLWLFLIGLTTNSWISTTENGPYMREGEGSVLGTFESKKKY